MALRVVFMGTPDYGVPSLEALISAGYDVVGVFCQPDKPSGRGKRIAFCPVKQCALAHGIPVVQPVKTRVDGVEPLRALKPDLCITAAFGHILSQEVLDIPREMLPEVRRSSEVYGQTNIGGKGGTRIPISGIAGDQQAALFGQLCVKEGMAKNTYGTGCFMLMNTGEKAVKSENGLLTTMAWRLNGKPTYALEGSVFMGGATIQWLRDEMKFVEKASQSEALATSIADNEGVYLVPAFTGLGAPHWSMYARGTLFGMTRGTGHAQIVRAGLESIAYQSNDLFQAMARDLGETPAVLRVDGGATANNFLMQFQADISGVAIQRPAVLETTALGAALLAGLAVGVYDNLAETAHGWHVESKFVPSMDPAQRQQLLHGWKRAVDAVLYWARED